MFHQRAVILARVGRKTLVGGLFFVQVERYFQKLARLFGVNRFTEQGNGPLSGKGTAPLFQIDPDAERQQIARVRALRGSRSASDWTAALAAVRQAALDGTNLMPPIVAAVEARVTVGEISDSLRDVFGEYKEIGGI